LFVAIGYITTEIVVTNSHFYNAFGLVPPTILQHHLLIKNSTDINEAFE
jgi:hypothetical protein